MTFLNILRLSALLWGLSVNLGCTAPLTIIIDPGHGGRDSGAIAKDGSLEKDLTLLLAKEIHHELENSGHTPILTRSDDSFLSIQERLVFAQKHTPDVLISIHCDTSPTRDSHGISLHTFNSKMDTQSKGVSLDVHFQDLVPESSGAPVDEILHSLRENTIRLKSEKLLNILETTLRKKLPSEHLFYYSGPFSILSSSNIPSILIEAGYISNTQDLKNLKDPKFRKKIAQGIKTALDFYSKE